MAQTQLTQDSSGPQFRANKSLKRQIDYTPLPNKLKVPCSNTNRENQLKRFQAEITELGADLSRMQPNMKAVDQFEDVESRLKVTQNALEQARNGAKQAESQFEMVKEKRSKRFNDAFNHIKKK